MTYIVEFLCPLDDSDWKVIESKGWFQGISLKFPDRKIALTFYDPIRLSQEIQSAHMSGQPLYEQHLIVVESVNLQQIEQAIHRIWPLDVFHGKA